MSPSGVSVDLASLFPGRLSANVTSSTKQEIHNISQRLQKRTKPFTPNMHGGRMSHVQQCNSTLQAPTPSPSARYRLVLSRRQKSSRTRLYQYNAEGTLACARRRSDVARCDGIDMPSYGPICADMTSSIKPEVHNVSQRCQRRPEPRSWVSYEEHKNLAKIGHRYARGQDT